MECRPLRVPKSTSRARSGPTRPRAVERALTVDRRREAAADDLRVCRGSSGAGADPTIDGRFFSGRGRLRRTAAGPATAAATVPRLAAAKSTALRADGRALDVAVFVGVGAGCLFSKARSSIWSSRFTRSRPRLGVGRP